MSLKLARRTMLKGAGAAIGLPALEVMLNSHGTAFAQGIAFPKRYVVWFFGNGVRQNVWIPAQTGPSWALTPLLQPLVDASRGVDVKSYVTVVSGHDIKTPNLRGHHNGVCAMMSGAPFIPLDPMGAQYSSKFSVKSVDQVIADAIAGDTPYKSLQLAVSKRWSKGEGPTLQYLSHRGPDQPMLQQTNPLTLFNQLFGTFTVKDPADPRDRMRANVLDAVTDDAKRLRLILGTADRARLDAHLTAISELRTRILALSPVVGYACVKPSAPTETNKDVNGVEPYESVNKVMSNLLALAFACDLTRVVSYQFSGSVGTHCFKSLSPTTARNNEHGLTHDAAAQNLVQDSVVFTMQNFAYTLNAMKKTIEGTGNLLDNSCVLCTSDVAEGLDHSRDDYPILVAGKAGGALNAGIHVRGSGQNTTNVLLACMKAVIGPQVASAGADSGASSVAAPILV